MNELVAKRVESAETPIVRQPGRERSLRTAASLDLPVEVEEVIELFDGVRGAGRICLQPCGSDVIAEGAQSVSVPKCQHHDALSGIVESNQDPFPNISIGRQPL